MKYLKFNKRTAVLLGLGMLILSFSFKSKYFEIAKQIEIYNALFKELNMYYVDEINPAELTNKAITNTLKDLDPYTNFYNAQDVEDAKVRREGEYGGIGVSVYYTNEGIQIKEIYKGFTADKAELQPGDIIFSVNGQSIKGLDRDQMSMMLKGTPNSEFSVQIKRANQVIKKQLKREKVVVNPVPFYQMIDEETGYLILTRFNNKASAEVKKAYRALKKEGMKKLIFDLRANPGGSLLESIRISNFFLPQNSPIVKTKGKIKEFTQTYRGNNMPLDLEIPIVVLINGRSASASEIVSGSLQDYDRAVILGERSFGKGLVQRQKPLTYGTQVKLTISKYYTPSGRCIQELDYTNRDAKTGIVPKFSDGGVNSFKTANGRTVYDGGGIMPDVTLTYNDKNETTDKLLASKAIFNYATYFYEKHPTIDQENFKVDDAIYKDFITFLKQDTTFVTESESLFAKAFKQTKNEKITKDYEKIKNTLFQEKTNALSENKRRIKAALQNEIIPRYLYKQGLYAYNLNRDEAILEAVKLLDNPKKYNQLLSVK